MVAQNKIIDYLKYAVGEILLVVIGILIAFQMNEWGQNKKNRTAEINILTEIKSNLLEDSIQIEDIIVKRSKATRSVARMLSEIPQHSFNLDTFKIDLGNFLTFDRFYPIKNAHEMLKSSGLSLSNKSLGPKISRYFDFLQEQLVIVNKDIELVFNELTFHKDIMSKEIIYFNWGKEVQVANPYDPVFLKELNYQLIMFRDNNQWALHFAIDTKKETTNCWLILEMN